MIGRPTNYFIACYIVLAKPNKVEIAVHDCSLDEFGLYHNRCGDLEKPEDALGSI